MPETPIEGIDDGVYHADVKPYFKAQESRFPYVGTNTPSCCGTHGGQLFWICPDCVKAETAWIRRHPKLLYPLYSRYGRPDPRL